VPARQFSDSIAFAGDVQDAQAMPDRSKVKNASSTTDAKLTARMVTRTPSLDYSLILLAKKERML
jgi:hypothetical protein